MSLERAPNSQDPRFNDWIFQLWKFVTTPNSGLNETNHAALGNLNSTNYTHLTAAQAAGLTTGFDSSLHIHSSDRNRANHTGTQAASTIQDFLSVVQLIPESPLFVLRSADLQLTTDQSFTKVGNFTNWIPTKIIAIRVTGGATVACDGGIYTAASKGGTAIVAAGQSWLNVTGSLGYTDATLAALTVALTVTPILSLTTGSTAAVTANLFIYGIQLD